jgi:hypothetical protein
LLKVWFCNTLEKVASGSNNSGSTTLVKPLWKDQKKGVVKPLMERPEEEVLVGCLAGPDEFM